MSISTLERARAGDHAAFAELTAPYLRELRLHCYRILGSLDDAEDLLQETLVAAWRGLGGFAGRSSVRAWLYRIATNRCLNALRDARRRLPPEPVPPFVPPEPSGLSDVTWLQPHPDDGLEPAFEVEAGPARRYEARESVELAFVGALQRLRPRQTAALLLRDVLDFSIGEVAEMLETSTMAVKGMLQRARASLDAQRRTGGWGDAPAPRSPAERDLATRFADAFTAGDIHGVVALLTDDAWLAMPPAPHEYRGKEPIAAFLGASVSWRRHRQLTVVPTRANTQPAYGCYIASPDGQELIAAGILVLTIEGDRIHTITRFLDSRLHARFGLPATLPGSEPLPNR